MKDLLDSIFSGVHESPRFRDLESEVVFLKKEESFMLTVMAPEKIIA